MGLDIFSALMDSYDRKARLNPVLLAIIPPVGVLVGLYAVRLQAQTALVGLLATFGIFYLLTSICRNLGKRLENSLYKSWGGKPTTQLLRHRDNTIDPITKKRYHTFLSQKIKTKFPTEDQELKKQNMADNVYSSAIEWLLGQTRDKKKFNLLFLENISYGFSRNCLGIKYIAISIALLSIAWAVIGYKTISTRNFSDIDFNLLPIGLLISLVTSISMLSVWTLFITKKCVKKSAFVYAEALLKTCDMLAQQETLMTVTAKASHTAPSDFSIDK